MQNDFIDPVAAQPAPAPGEPQSLPQGPSNFSLQPSAFGLSPHPRRLRGKVACLPLEMRNLVNQSLRQGLAYVEIASLLESHGHPGLTSSNLSNWYQGGYRDWLSRQEALEARHSHSDHLQALAGQLSHDGKSPTMDLNQQLLADGLQQVLADFDFHSLRPLLQAKPAEFFRLAHLVNAQSALQPQRQFVYLAAQRRPKGKEDKPKRLRGLTPEILREMEEKAKIL